MKYLLDEVLVISNNIANWEKLSWESVDLENIIVDSNYCLQELNNIINSDKDIKNWSVFSETKTKSENFIKSIKSLKVLKNAAIESHHWIELMRIHKEFNKLETFELSRETQLKDLLDLKLEKTETLVNK